MPKQICHAHCPRGGGGGAVLVVLAVIVTAAIARPVVHAVSLVLEVAVVAAASALGLAAIGAVAFLAVRAHHRQTRARQALAWHTPTAAGGSQAVSAPQPLAIEAPRPSLADLQDLAVQHGYDLTREED